MKKYIILSTVLALFALTGVMYNTNCEEDDDWVMVPRPGEKEEKKHVSERVKQAEHEKKETEKALKERLEKLHKEHEKTAETAQQHMGNIGKAAEQFKEKSKGKWFWQ